MNSFDIMKASQIACCLEVSSFKPGNVHRNKDYDDIKYHHFLNSGVAFGDIIYKASKDPQNIGQYIKLAVIESKKWSPSNANLGIIMLHTPIATTTGQMEEFNINTLKKEIKNTVKNTTTDDAIAVYDAIEIAMPNINPPKEGPDAQKNDAKQELREKNLTLYDVFKISSSWDSISYEWTKGFNISFEGYYLLNKYYKQYNNINLATTKTFLNILSNHPDTLIARKKDENTSKMVSDKAKEVLNNFNEESLLKFDKFLSNEGNKLNPGTTADLIASSLMIFLLDRINNKNTVLW